MLLMFGKDLSSVLLDYLKPKALINPLDMYAICLYNAYLFLPHPENESQFIIEEPHFRESCLDWTAHYGELFVLQWLWTTKKSTSYENATILAARQGHLHIIEWLLGHNLVRGSNSAIDHAAAAGLLHVVQWLATRCNARCSSIGMTYAAENDHLFTVQWLYYNQPWSYRNTALENAADRGRLDIVKWIYETVGTGFCTHRAIYYAKSHEYSKHVAEWLSLKPTIRSAVCSELCHVHVKN